MNNAVTAQIPVQPAPIPVQPRAGTWKSFAEPRPYATTIGLAFDENGRFPIIHRSPQVRSAKNCWSLISGLHEVGLRAEQQLEVELIEEAGLFVIPGTARQIGFFENISAEDSWHWVLLLMAVRVRNLGAFINREPDKHDDYKVIGVDQIQTISPWSPGLKEALLTHLPRIYEVRDELCGVTVA